MGQWWSRNNDGYWCDFCGEWLAALHQFENDDEADAYEPPDNCPNCGAPDEFDPDAI